MKNKVKFSIIIFWVVLMVGIILGGFYYDWEFSMGEKEVILQEITQTISPALGYCEKLGCSRIQNVSIKGIRSYLSENPIRRKPR